MPEEYRAVPGASPSMHTLNPAVLALLFSLCALCMNCGVALAAFGPGGQWQEEIPHQHGGCIEIDPNIPDVTIDFDLDKDGKLSEEEERLARRWMKNILGYVDEDLIKMYK